MENIFNLTIEIPPTPYFSAYTNINSDNIHKIY